MKKTSFEETMTNFNKRMLEMQARAELADFLRTSMDSWKKWDYYEETEGEEMADWKVENNQKVAAKIELLTNYINQLLA